MILAINIRQLGFCSIKRIKAQFVFTHQSIQNLIGKPQG